MERRLRLLSLGVEGVMTCFYYSLTGLKGNFRSEGGFSGNNLRMHEELIITDLTMFRYSDGPLDGEYNYMSKVITQVNGVTSMSAINLRRVRIPSDRISGHEKSAIYVQFLSYISNPLDYFFRRWYIYEIINSQGEYNGKKESICALRCSEEIHG
jgi:hypothetical protein